MLLSSYFQVCGSLFQFQFGTKSITEISQEIIFYRCGSTSSKDIIKNTLSWGPVGLGSSIPELQGA